MVFTAPTVDVNIGNPADNAGWAGMLHTSNTFDFDTYQGAAGQLGLANSECIAVLLKVIGGRKFSEKDKERMPAIRNYMKSIIGDAADVLFDHIEEGELIFKDESLIEECLDKLEEWENADASFAHDTRPSIYQGSPADGHMEIEPDTALTYRDDIGIVTEVTMYDPPMITGTGEFFGEESNLDVAMSPASGTIGEK